MQSDSGKMWLQMLGFKIIRKYKTIQVNFKPYDNVIWCQCVYAMILFVCVCATSMCPICPKKQSWLLTAVIKPAA